MIDPINPHSLVLHKARKQLLRRSKDTRKNSYEAQVVASLEAWQIVANDLRSDNIALTSEVKDWKWSCVAMAIMVVSELIVMMSMGL